MSHWKVNSGWFEGSLFFEEYASSVGLQVDKFNFTVSLLTVIALSLVYRRLLPPEKVGVVFRNIFSACVGVLIVSFCFGRGIIHMIAQACGSYVIMKFVPTRSMPWLCLAFNMVYQSAMHLYRVYYDYGGYTLDITGSLMLLTQRLTMLAFSIRDATDDIEVSEHFASLSVTQTPGLLSYIAYVFHFQGVLAGPSVPYKDFEHVSNHGSTSSQNGDPDNKHVVPYLVIVYNIFMAASFIAATLYIGAHLPFTIVLNKDMNPLMRIGYIFVILAGIKCQYYFIWYLGDAAHLASGYGYRSTKDYHDWTATRNVNPLRIHFGSSLKVILENWNIYTQKWLRFVCYDRVDKKYNPMLATFLLSALWHGFYPGYYITFVSMHFFVTAARTVRRYIRPYFQENAKHRLFYDFVTTVASLCALDYAAFPFFLLNVEDSIQFYTNLFFYYHILVFIAIYSVPLLMKRPSATSVKPPKLPSVNKR